MGTDISRGQDDDGLRWYTDGDSEYMSVTTVLGFLDEDKTGLERWQAQNDGTGDKPHHEHIFWYSGPCGTICHYEALSQFEHAYEGEDMWGAEETESTAQIMSGPHEGEFEDASHDPSDVTYSILKRRGAVETRDQYEALFEGNTRLVDVLDEETEYFVEKFEKLCEDLGVDDDSVLHVEKYLLNDEVGYGGQCDMVYEDPHGNVVVVDLKTSSSLRQKHRLQSVAYMKAVEAADWGPEHVDRVEVWRISPSKQNYEVHSHTVPTHADDLGYFTDDNWFVDPWGEFSYDSIEHMWDKFTDLVEEAHYAATKE